MVLDTQDIHNIQNIQNVQNLKNIEKIRNIQSLQNTHHITNFDLVLENNLPVNKSKTYHVHQTSLNQFKFS